MQGFPQKVEKPCFWRWEGDIPGCAWFSPSLSAAAASCRRLRSYPLSVPFFRKEISFFLSPAAPVCIAGCLVRAREHGRALVTGPPCAPAARSRDGRKVHRARCAPLAPTEPGPVSRVAHCWAAILQHDLYSPSALGLDAPPLRWLRSGSRGDSLRGLVHTSPLRHRVRPGGATVATTPVYVHPAAAERQRGQLHRKSRCCGSDTTAARVLALSHGGCNPRDELVCLPVATRKFTQGPLQRLTR